MSRAKAINEMCRTCIYDPIQKGAWRQQVEDCTSVECPLFEFRPRSAAKTGNKSPQSGGVSEILDPSHLGASSGPLRSKTGQFVGGVQ